MSNIIHTSAGNIYAPVIKPRQQNQTERIQAGVNDGSLNRVEHAAIGAQRVEMRQDLREAKANDGYLDGAERQAARQDLNQISRSIFAFRHD